MKMEFRHNHLTLSTFCDSYSMTSMNFGQINCLHNIEVWCKHLLLIQWFCQHGSVILCLWQGGILLLIRWLWAFDYSKSCDANIYYSCSFFIFPKDVKFICGFLCTIGCSQMSPYMIVTFIMLVFMGYVKSILRIWVMHFVIALRLVSFSSSWEFLFII